MTNLLSQCNFWLQGSQGVLKVALFPNFLAIFVVFRHNFILYDFIPHHLKFHNFLQIISCSCHFLPNNFMPSHFSSRHVLSCHILICHSEDGACVWQYKRRNINQLDLCKIFDALGQNKKIVHYKKQKICIHFLPSYGVTHFWFSDADALASWPQPNTTMHLYVYE